MPERQYPLHYSYFTKLSGTDFADTSEEFEFENPEGDELNMKNLSIIAVAILALSFTGCTAQSVDDAAITTKVTGKFAVDQDTSALKIEVATANGVVTLKGTVPTQSEKDKAEQIARNTEGVKKVINNINVNPDPAAQTTIGREVDKVGQKIEEKTEEIAGAATATISDATILARIKTQYAAVGIIGTNVDVTKGEVVIKGEVGSAAVKSRAEEIARQTPGVKGVKNMLTVKLNS